VIGAAHKHGTADRLDRRGPELLLSPNTIKSQAISLYRKLGVAIRSQAVARSRELALLEG
jgi:ATP/maltotriose-dependent transcriptional regulator MalT